MSSKGYASLVRSRGAGYALAGLVLVLVVGCSDSAEERLPPVPDSATSGAAIEPVGPVETVAEALPSEGGTTTTLNRESSEQAATSADPTTPEDIESGIDAAVAPHDPAAVDVVRGPRTDSEEGESPDAVDQPEPDIDPGTSQLQVDDPQPITGGLLSGLYRPDIRIRFGDGESSAMVAGAIGPPGRQVYIVEAAAGQLLTASLDSEPGVWLDLRLGGTVILSQGRGSPLGGDQPALRRSVAGERCLPGWRAGLLRVDPAGRDTRVRSRSTPPRRFPSDAASSRGTSST